MKWCVVILASLLVTATALAGDYRLTVANDKHASCVRGPAAQGHPDWPVLTAKEVSDDLFRYFQGKTPHLKLFVPFFTNARITFCGAEERREVYEAMVAILQLPSIRNEFDLYDYCYLLGSRELLGLIDLQLRQKLSSAIAKRLQKARAAVLKGLKARHQ